MSEQYSSIIEGLLFLQDEIAKLTKSMSKRGIVQTSRSSIRDLREGELVIKTVLDYLEEIWYNQDSNKKSKNSTYKNRIERFKINTSKILLLANGEFFDDIIESLLNVFFRLTSYSSGSMVSLYDLVDLQTAKHMCTKASIGGNDDFLCLRNWKLVVEGLLFTLYSLGINFPSPYYPGLAVLEKKDTLQQALIDLEKSFEVKTEKTE